MSSVLSRRSAWPRLTERDFAYLRTPFEFVPTLRCHACPCRISLHECLTTRIDLITHFEVLDLCRRDVGKGPEARE